MEAEIAPHAHMARRTRLPRRLLWGAPALCLIALLGAGLALRLRPAAAPADQGAPPAPQFSLPIVTPAGVYGGARLALRALRGHPVLLTFFNSQCGPCLDELPLLRRAAQQYRAQGVIVLGVDALGDSAATARRLAMAAHVSYPVVVDNQTTAWQYGVSMAPTSFFVDAQGRLRGEQDGPLDAQSIRDGLAAAGAIHCPSCAPAGPLNIAMDTPSEQALNAGNSDFVFQPPRALPAFTLRDQHSHAITPASLRGKVVALTFISALCTEQCPLVGKTLSLALRQLGPSGARLAVVAISVDPELDTPAATRRFAADSGWQGIEWHYLTAPRATLARVWNAYGIYVPKPAPIFKTTQSIIHQTGLFLIDQRGRLRAYDNVPLLVPRVVAAMHVLLNA